jgi:IS605 OrfB family transposase
MILEGGAVSPRKPAKVPKPDAKPKSAKQLRALEKKAAALYTPPGHVRIKLLCADGQWRFSAPLKVRGRMKRLAGKLHLAPTLVLKGKKVALSCPVEFNRPWYMTDKTFQDSALGKLKEKVCAGDAGINTAITAAVVDASGTVINRRFIRCDRHDGQRDALMEQIDRKRSQSGSSMRGQPFCHELYERISGIGLEAARYLAREFVAFARANGARILVIENLKGFRPKGRGPRQKRRFHRFEHRRWVQCVKQLAEEFGLRVLEVWPRGTSRWAYDGSGEVTRDKSNAANATFASGKRYNADLNGACNIAARGLAMLLGIKAPVKHTTKALEGSAPCPAIGTGGGKSSPPKERMPLVLSHVWEWFAAQHTGAPTPGPLVTDTALMAT